MPLPQRHCLILQGDSDWLDQQAEAVFAKAQADKRCWLSDDPQRPAGAISSKQALHQLGRSNQLIIFDARHQFSADAFGALIGTLSAGGWLLLLLPATFPNSLWLQRFVSLSESDQGVERIHQGEPLPEIHLAKPTLPVVVSPTPEQAEAIKAVKHVVSGHRRRPLLIVSDRGRGKTALLGMAAAELIKQGKSRILVTAPSVANIEPLLEHACLVFPNASRSRTGLLCQYGEIQFIAPDALIADKPSADLLIVDEAAAIPLSMLEAMLQHYSRLVFATTEHGYEGTGRGFALRFKQTLDRLTPNWRRLTLNQPVRWAADDKLEAFSFEALLLNAEPVAEAELSQLSVHEAEFVVLDKKQLVASERLLREVYGLMVLAHYRTRPSDLQMLLDRDDVSVLVLQARGHIIASAWVVKEAPLDRALAEQVFDGQRRLKGQLLPQTLLAHSGVLSAGDCCYLRIIRIAVHPERQGMGLGSHLLSAIRRHYAGQADVIGTSFALDSHLLHFWLNNNYLPVRVGQQADEVSGQRAGILLQSLSKAGDTVVSQARESLQRTWSYQLLQSQCELDTGLVIAISQTLPAEMTGIDTAQQRAITGFAFSQRPFESIEPVLWHWLCQKLTAGELAALPADAQSLLVKKILQGQSFSKVAELLALPGRKAIIEQCRLAVASLLKQSENNTHR